MYARYPWNKLKRPGSSFVWPDREDERSLRSQANKQGKRRGVVYSVAVESPSQLRVTYVCGVP